MNKLKVAVGHTEKTVKGSSSKSRQFFAKVMDSKKPLVTKTASYGRDRTIDEAYAKMCEYASDLAKEYKVTKPQIPPLADMVNKKRNRITLADTPSETNQFAQAIQNNSNELVERFGHQGRFLALMKHAVKLHGVDKLEEVLNGGLEYVKSARQKIQQEKLVIESANNEIAMAIKKARDAGVDMPAPPEIEEIIQNLSRKKLPSRDAYSYKGTYKLGDETFYGDGKTMLPPNFARYLAANPDKTIDDLKVPGIPA